jgi:transcriptional regulator with XRE-family HTH domain
MTAIELRAERTRRGLTQKALGILCGYSAGHIRHLESGVRMILKPRIILNALAAYDAELSKTKG